MTEKASTEEVKPAGVPPASSSRIAELKGYIQIIGTVEIVFGILDIILGIFCTIAAIFVPIIIAESDEESPEYLPIFIGIAILVVAILFLAFGIISIVSGKRLMAYQNSGRTGTMIVAVISVFSFPFGTIFGIAALYVCTRPEAEQIFS